MKEKENKHRSTSSSLANNTVAVFSSTTSPHRSSVNNIEITDQQVLQPLMETASLTAQSNGSHESSNNTVGDPIIENNKN